MRIADKMQFNQIQKNITKNRSEMTELQNQAATQKRITKPSDDPLASARVLTNRAEDRASTQFIKNINYAKGFLEFTDQSLGELTEILVRAKELAISQAGDSGGTEETRRITGAEVEQLYNQSVQIGNRKLGERYVFGGYRTQSQPFDQDGEYYGDDGSMQVQTHKDSFVAMNLPGDKVFLGKGIGGDGIIRSVDRKPKTVDEIGEFQQSEAERLELEAEQEAQRINIQSPSNQMHKRSKRHDPTGESGGVNVFGILKGLEISLRTNDKEAVQQSMDQLDDAISQVVLARSEVGARVMAINGTTDSLQKAIVDSRSSASNLEDADVFQVVSDISKTDSTLKATLETSSKLVERNLMDFLR